MSLKVYQCCYTNAVRNDGNTISSGWQAVSVSPDMPTDALNACINLQSANSAIQTNMVDEFGNTLNLYEIIGDGNYLYLIRTQYGLVDRLGRPNMFSHGIVFSLKDVVDIIKRPYFLLLRKENFKSSEEETAEFNIAALSYDVLTPPSVASAMESLGMNKAAYVKLIRCAFAKISEGKTGKPLYIEYDGTEEQMRAILICLYCGLPYYLRRNLSIVSVPGHNERMKNIVFSIRAKEFEQYIIPQTGENNVLTQRVERKIERFGYVDHAVGKLETHEYEQFFDMLEAEAQRLGDATASNELILKVAFRVLQAGNDFASFTDEDLEHLLSDAMRCSDSINNSMENLISQIVSEINRRDYTLTAENERTLDDWLASAKTQELKDACLGYQIHRLAALPVQEAAERLKDVPTEAFFAYREQLSETAIGTDILECYFSTMINNEEQTWEGLNRIWLEADALPSKRKKMMDDISNTAFEMYEEERASEGVVSAFGHYSELMKKILSEKDFDRFVFEMKSDYWKNISLGTIDFNSGDEYQFMKLADDKKCRQFQKLVKVVQKFSPSDVAPFLEDIYSFSSEAYLSSDDIRLLTNRILDYLVCQGKLANGDGFKPWLRFAMNAEKKKQIDGIVKMYGALTPTFDAGLLLNAFKSFSDTKFSQLALNVAYKEIKELVLTECIRNDSKATPIPLDLWLLAGDTFNVFNRVDAFILTMDPREVVGSSGLMAKKEWSSNARKYVDYKGEEARVVKKWLNEVSKNSGNTDNGGSGKQQEKNGFFGGLFGKKKP